MISACGAEADLLDCHPCRIAAGVVAAGGVVEGRRDPHAAPSPRRGPARAASCSCASDVARPGVAGAGSGDGAGGAPGGDAADRHSRHDRALAARHRAPPVGAPVAPGPVRAPGDASQGAVGGAAAGQGERVVGIPADPWRARGSRHHGGAVHGLADPQGRWHQPAPRRDGPGWAEFPRSRVQGILALDFFTADLLNGTKACVLAVIEHGTRRVRILGATEHPVQSWVVQQARSLLMGLEDAGVSVKFVLHDGDASFTAAFDAVFQAGASGSSAPLFRRPG
jgi:hypothetical protein